MTRTEIELDDGDIYASALLQDTHTSAIVLSFCSSSVTGATTLASRSTRWPPHGEVFPGDRPACTHGIKVSWTADCWLLCRWIDVIQIASWCRGNIDGPGGDSSTTNSHMHGAAERSHGGQRCRNARPWTKAAAMLLLAWTVHRSTH
jgi:hypothetical protein